MSYVEIPCGHCGRYAPRYEYTEVSDRIVTGGKTGTYKTYANGSSGYIGGQETYKIVHRLLCGNCYGEYVAQQQRAVELEARRRALERNKAVVIGIGIIVAISAGVVALDFVKQENSSKSSVATNVLAQNATTAPAQSISAAGNIEAASAENAATGDSAIQDNVLDKGDEELRASQDMQSPAATSALEGAAIVAAITPENTPALSRAIADSLDTGTLKSWAVNGQSGEVTVGAIRYYQGRPCRSFIYTVAGAASPTLYACDGVDGVWRPESRFRNQGAP